MAEEQVTAGAEQQQREGGPSKLHLDTSQPSSAVGALRPPRDNDDANKANNRSSILTIPSPIATQAPPTTPANPSSQLSIITDIPRATAPLTTTAPPPKTSAAIPPTIPEASKETSRPTIESAGGAAAATTNSSSASASGPHLSISLMLHTGARHPYKLDEKYLRSRKVSARGGGPNEFDPRELSGYQLKELIWTDWRAEWEPKPSSPSSIRLIIMGRMIEDKATLKEFPFSLESPNVVHMTVKPADTVDDDDTNAKTAGKAGIIRSRDSEDRGAGCRCVIL